MHKKELRFLLLLLKLPSKFKVMLTETENVWELKTIFGQLHGLLSILYLNICTNEREFLNGFREKDKTFLKQKKLLHLIVTVAALEVMLRKTERVLELSVIWKKLYCLL